MVRPSRVPTAYLASSEGLRRLSALVQRHFHRVGGRLKYTVKRPRLLIFVAAQPKERCDTRSHWGTANLADAPARASEITVPSPSPRDHRAGIRWPLGVEPRLGIVAPSRSEPLGSRPICTKSYVNRRFSRVVATCRTALQLMGCDHGGSSETNHGSETSITVAGHHGGQGRKQQWPTTKCTQSQQAQQANNKHYPSPCFQPLP